MKNHETTLKNHGNQPKTMKNHETTLKNHGSDDFLLQTYRQTDTSPLYIYHHPNHHHLNNHQNIDSRTGDPGPPPASSGKKETKEAQ